MDTDPKRGEADSFNLTSATLRLRGLEHLFSIEGNPHTHAGRFSVIEVNTGRYELVSLRDVAWASPSAAAWIAGFLAGQEPDPWQFFGDEPAEEHVRWWEGYVERFRVSGEPGRLSRFPADALPADIENVRASAWTCVGDTIVRWSVEMDGWVFTTDRIADLQPASQCIDEAGHDGEALSDSYNFFCRKCFYFSCH